MGPPKKMSPTGSSHPDSKVKGYAMPPAGQAAGQL